MLKNLRFLILILFCFTASLMFLVPQIVWADTVSFSVRVSVVI